MERININPGVFKKNTTPMTATQVSDAIFFAANNGALVYRVGSWDYRVRHTNGSETYYRLDVQGKGSPISRNIRADHAKPQKITVRMCAHARSGSEVPSGTVEYKNLRGELADWRTKGASVSTESRKRIVVTMFGAVVAVYEPTEGRGHTQSTIRI
ncbi:hypothetical protein BIV57_11895 [Mangrovactinospora gilvigrisea]|uniref:Uncharacterized protein n=1 Tax=Mangrovactinospora gilvigrisea TaxID=1428644 RepID=A0A1J7BF60_9ACTN|nr:hypothetical protein [Mangrovactinospora gilvigrisea]OIV37278.1 hypothetical protein BIV57_11895 [Mangrovactinospora gilvigrisea]